VADLVLRCTDSASADPAQKRPWLERKTAYLERLAHADQPAALITAADKLHNITATIRDVRAHGPETLARFNAPDQVIWHYRSVADALEPHAATLPMAEFRAAIGELSALVAAGARVDPDAGHQTIIEEGAS
jgi:NAD dependent epimerase/dehydratase family enzyme